MTIVKAVVNAVGSNVLIIPISNDGDTWTGKVHSVGERGQYSVSWDDIVIYKNEHIIEFKCPEKDPVSGKLIELSNSNLHSVLYYQIIGKIRPQELKEKNETFNFEGLDHI